jgi:Na+/H+ antiporter NhaD/arsenite permease-like protein
LLSSVLANDIVCFAFTPVLAISVLHANLNPMPFLIGLAVSSNIGSAATIIGNPQNMLIGQVGKLDFAEFLFWCGPPAAIALVGSYLVILLIYRKKFHCRNNFQAVETPEKMPSFNCWQTAKGITVTGVLMVLFFTPVPREISAVGVAGAILCSRRMKTRDILGLVDWHLITLFCALFVVIHAVSLGNYPQLVVTLLAERGIDLHNLLKLTVISTVLSNVFSNVPAAMLLVRFLDTANPAEWFTLAVSSTFAGNLIIIGSIANLIVIEQAAKHGIQITFRQHAAVGLPVTLVSFLVLIVWIFI